MVASSTIISWPRHSTASAIQRRRSRLLADRRSVSSPVASSPVPGCSVSSWSGLVAVVLIKCSFSGARRKHHSRDYHWSKYYHFKRDACCNVVYSRRYDGRGQIPLLPSQLDGSADSSCQAGLQAQQRGAPGYAHAPV